MEDLGFDLLMNPKKKQSNDDNMSVRSSAAPASVKSVEIKPVMMDGGESELSYDVATESEYSIQMSPQRQRHEHRHEHRHRPHTPSEAASDESESYAENEGGGSRMSEEEILKAKQEFLYQFDRLEKKGIKLPRKFSLASSLEEMKTEYERLKRDKEVDASVKFQRRMVLAFASGVEFLNDRFDPFDIKLSGWSEKLHDDIDDYDDVFEELHEKYKGKAKIAPELKLVFMMGSSAFMFHLTNSLFKQSTIPGLEQVLKQNPELMKQFAAATANTMAQQQRQANGGGGGMFGGLANMFSSMFGGGGGGDGGQQRGPPSVSSGSERSTRSMPQRPQATRMKGPSNVDDILKELNMGGDDDRIEMMSTVTESELFDIPDDGSINGLLMTSKKKGRKGKNTVSLDL
jgi:hypothetical protein